MSTKRYSVDFKQKVLQAYKNGECTIKELRSKYHITKTSLYEWNEKFEKYGLEGLENRTYKSERRYSKELKEAAVRDYLFGEISQYEIARKYDISNRTTLRKWINKYNSHSELKDTLIERASTMTKGKKRKTTIDERIQIVFNCLGNGKDYQKSADTYGVSYQQVYQWVKKYEDGGAEALNDRRGRKKEETELSPKETIRLEMKKLERENERLRAENAYLKKLEEIERRPK